MGFSSGKRTSVTPNHDTLGSGSVTLPSTLLPAHPVVRARDLHVHGARLRNGNDHQSLGVLAFALPRTVDR